jgi:hypothetical protein
MEKDMLASWSPREILLPAVEDFTTELSTRSAARSEASTSSYFEVSRILPDDLQVEARDANDSSHGTPVEICDSSTSSQRTVRAGVTDIAVLDGRQGPRKRGVGFREDLAFKRPRRLSL